MAKPKPDLEKAPSKNPTKVIKLNADEKQQIEKQRARAIERAQVLEAINKILEAHSMKLAVTPSQVVITDA